IRLEDLVCAVGARQLRLGPHCDDAAGGNGDGARRDDAMLGIHGHDGAVAHEQVDLGSGGGAGGERQCQAGSDHTFRASNGIGSSADIRSVFERPARFSMWTQTSPQNSQMIWRHGPQGAARWGESTTTAMASKGRSPSETALKTAVRSAQIVRPYE